MQTQVQNSSLQLSLFSLNNLEKERDNKMASCLLLRHHD